MANTNIEFYWGKISIQGDPTGMYVYMNSTAFTVHGAHVSAGTAYLTHTNRNLPIGKTQDKIQVTVSSVAGDVDNTSTPCHVQLPSALKIPGNHVVGHITLADEN